MSSDQQVLRPDVIVPDATPLIHLAQANALHLLHEIGAHVVVSDVVVFEATRYLDKPGAKEVEAWISVGIAEGSNAPIEVVETQIGETYRLAVQANPSHKFRDAGEHSIIEWLRNYTLTNHHDLIIVYENGKVPEFMSHYNMDANIDIITTRAFLDLVERRHIAPSAEAIWDKVIEAVPTANPKVEMYLHRRPPQTNDIER